MIRPPQALLVLSFGGPEGLDDILPFLHNVTAGRGVPEERLAVVAEQYRLFGGVSPINAQNRQLVSQVDSTLRARGLHIPVYWGNRNWQPYVGDTLAEMAADGITSAAVFVTSAFGSYSGCRQYRENLAGAADRAVQMELTKLRLFFDHPLFIEIMADALAAALKTGAGDRPPLVAFSAHSIPASLSPGSPYEQQLRAACGWVAERAGAQSWTLAYQSRSGPPQVPWLGPDVSTLVTRAAAEERPLVVCPIGFVSDHMEVVYDLDTLLAGQAEEAGVRLIRTATAAGDVRFPELVADLLAETLDPATPRPSLSPEGGWPLVCPADCCPPPRRPSAATEPPPTRPRGADAGPSGKHSDDV